jgi:tetratricopeptide (TPR) repeat protein
MPLISGMQIPPPQNWQDFETLCCDLWRRIWKDQDTRKHGRQGQPQQGVDIYGRPNREEKWAGVQCKGKDNYSDKSLSHSELIAEVKKALKFVPPLSEFTIATMAPRDVNLQELARKITTEHQKQGLFSVTISFWDDIKDRLAEFPDVIEIHYPQLLSTEAIKDIKEIKEGVINIQKEHIDNTSLLVSLHDKIEPSPHYQVPVDTSVLTTEYHAEIDYARELIKNNNPSEALQYLLIIKDRIWSQAPPIIKYRILTNIGAANLLLNIKFEAAKSFLEAFQYNDDDEKALCNKALAHLLLDQLHEAIEQANIALEKNPGNTQAYCVIIQASKEKDLPSIIDIVPESYRKSPEVSSTIAQIAQGKKMNIEAKNWLEIALENNGTHVSDFKGALGTILLDIVLENQFAIYFSGIDEKGKEDIERAIQLLSEAWDSVEGSDLKELRVGWLVNRAIAKKFLCKWEDAIKDIDICLDVEQNNPILMKYKAMLCYENKDTQTGIDLLGKILLKDETPEAGLILGEFLRKEKHYSDAVSILTDFLGRKPSQILSEEANRLLIQIYIERHEEHDLERAKEISASMRSVDPTSILNLVDAAKVSRSLGEKSEAISLLMEASKYVSETSEFKDLYFLADEFYSFELFDEASKLYERIANTEINTPLTKRLINSLYFSSDRKNVLKICQTLREKYGPIMFVSEMEAAIYQEIDNIPKAKDVIRDYLKSFPDDFHMKLNLALLNFRSNCHGELDSFLNQPVDIDKLSLLSAHNLAYLYGNRNMSDKALKVLYETRRKFFNESDAHLKYIGFILSIGKDVDNLMNFTSIIPDAAVCIETDKDKQEWYILDDREDADIRQREIRLEHRIAKSLTGKNIGDEVILRETPLSKEIGRITEIKSKYLYAFHESLDLFEKLFPESQGLWKVKVEISEEAGQLSESFRNILEVMVKQQDWVKQLEQLYKQQKITIGAFAKVIGSNVIEVVGGLINNEEIGIKCCNGNHKERTHAITLLSSKPKLIIDIISLLFIFELNQENNITKVLGKFGIAQSTIDLINEILLDLEGLKAKGFMTISKRGEQFLKREVSAEDVRKNTESLKNLLSWIDDNCEIFPVTAALAIKKNRRDDLNKLLGRSFVDTMLISTDPGNLLYTDDFQLRMLAKNDFHIDGIWTQPLLMHCLGIGALSRDAYNKYIVKLISSNLTYISVDYHVLIEAARQANWVPSQPFDKVVMVLSGDTDEPSALIVAVNFFLELWKQPISPFNRDILITKLLNEITIGRNKRVMLTKLKEYVKIVFRLIPSAGENLNHLISIWEQTIIII